MHFRTFSDLSVTVHANLHRLPPDIDLVIGIPRSGLLPASIVALSLNMRLADLDGFMEGRLLATGVSRRTPDGKATSNRFERVLVVDDSIHSGRSIREARAKLEAAHPDKQFHFCCVYGLTPTAPGVDLILEAVPHPRMFQWNFMHHPQLDRCCVDIDGVLCVDPTEEENDDGPRYLEFLQQARPISIPSQRVGYLVTSRLERYRPQTEAWLASQGVRYRELIMLDLPSKQARQAQRAHGSFKAATYQRLKETVLFIESDLRQAKEIAARSGKPVLAFGAQKLCLPSATSVRGVRYRLGMIPERIAITHHHQLAPVKRTVRRLLGEARWNAIKRRTHVLEHIPE